MTIAQGEVHDAAYEFKVLVADDSRVYRKLIEHSLSDKGYALLFAESGREALALFAEHEPSIVITDWMMPDLSGIELCEHIRKQSRQPYTYVIILTGNTEKDKLVTGLAAGADDYLTKPFHRGELLARLGVGHRIVELHRQLEAKNRLLEELALTDPLTGQPNRRAIEDWATRQLSGAQRYGFGFLVVLAHVDHLKAVNDTYGRAAGDSVLKKLSEILKANSRRSDICGRIGGEEFLLILTHTTQENAKLVIDRIRRALEAAKFDFESGSLTVTASFGLAGLEGAQPADFNQLIIQAEAALSAAKQAGRNRTEIAATPVA
jgi:two-component system cell cycle response regulator